MKSCMKTTLALSIVIMAIVLLLPSSASCQADYDDVVYLKDGSIIRGVIIEQIPGESIKLKTKDGNIFVFKTEEIEKFTKEAPLETPVASSNSFTGEKIGSKKEPGVAFLLSFVLTGGGQFYNGESSKGIKMLGGAAVGIALYFGFRAKEVWVYDYYNVNYGYWEDDDGTPVLANAGLGLAIAASVYSMVDAIQSANRLNQENGWAKVDDKPKLQLALVDMSPGKAVAPGLRLSLSF